MLTNCLGCSRRRVNEQKGRTRMASMLTVFSPPSPVRGLLLIVLILLLDVCSRTGNGEFAALHCQDAEQRCEQDSACALLQELRQKTCGDTYDGTVCRATSLDTCQGTLRSLWTHELFGGSSTSTACVCGDGIEEADCRRLRDGLSSHPCLTVPRRNVTTLNGHEVTLTGNHHHGHVDGDQYGSYLMNDDVPTCTYALDLCHRNSDKCKKIYDYFRRMCKVKSGLCNMHSRIKCQQAWTKIQLTPVYGCLCHTGSSVGATNGDSDIEKCAKIYALVNRNPCVELLESAATLPSVPGGDHALIPEVVTPLTDEHKTNTLKYPSSFFVHTPEEEGGEDGGGRGAGEPGTSPSLVSPLYGAVIGLHMIQSHPNTVVNGHRNNGREPRVTGPPPDVLHSSTGIKAKSTCQRAFQLCEADAGCKILLGNMLQACEAVGAPCNRTECMSAVRDFYHVGNPHTMRAVAFCICKYNDQVCLIQQRKLHPPCAQRPEVEMPGCHEVADQCRANPDCRPRMERFVEACAVDRSTLQCQSPLEDCRLALMDILGSPLRTNCACSGNDFATLYYCIEWQRLVWLNPCVVQAQKDFHEGGRPPTDAPAPQPTRIRPQPGPTHRAIQPTMKTTTTTTEQHHPDDDDDDDIDSSESYDPDVPDISSDERSVVTTISAEITTDNQEHCLVKGKYKIPVSKGRRLYQAGSECSTICICLLEHQLTCHEIGCPDLSHCNSSMATYSHSAPTYIAFRGNCRCYSGKFICVKPPDDKYELNPGVYLFLGYSAEEERQIFNHTNVAITSVVSFLQKMINANKDVACKLALNNQFEGNLIIQAYLEEFDEARANNSISLDMLHKEKAICYPNLLNITNLINDNHEVIREDIVLSVLKLAKIEVREQPASSGAGVALYREQRTTLYAGFLLTVVHLHRLTSWSSVVLTSLLISLLTFTYDSLVVS